MWAGAARFERRRRTEDDSIRLPSFVFRLLRLYRHADLLQQLECYYQKAIHRLRRTRTTEPPRYMYYIMLTSAYIGVFVAEGNSNTIDHLTAEKLQKHKFPFPPFEEQQAIVKYLDSETAHIDSLVALIQEQTEKLRTYRQALITAAVTGKIDVRGAVQ
jgi:type I restriction enzyme S subunit